MAASAEGIRKKIFGIFRHDDATEELWIFMDGLFFDSIRRPFVALVFLFVLLEFLWLIVEIWSAVGFENTVRTNPLLGSAQR